jgi:rare lipoprotein A
MRQWTVLAVAAALLAAPGLALAQSQPEHGLAAVYASRYVGHKTASGEILDRQHPTAAHRKYPFGTLLEVTNRNNGRKVVVKVNDRGPHSRRFAIDFSPAAAAALGIKGTAPVEYHIVSAP